MKKLFTAFCLLCCLTICYQTANAQAKHAFHFRANYLNYVNPQPDWSDWRDVFSDIEGRGIEVGYNYRLDKSTWLSIPFKMGLPAIGSDKRSGFRDRMVGNLDVLAQKNLTRLGSVFVPNLHLGLGSTYNFDDNEFDFNIPAGLGLNVRIWSNAYITAQTQYRFSIENRPGWHHSVGMMAYLGGEAPDDTDGDGVADKEDKCPSVPGVAALMGCPDRDGDGITDADDKCPDQKGIATFMGCPDSDGDGIADAEDKCPNEKGLAKFTGCPDTDNDGIVDADDACPRESGPANNKGCPIKDRDGDGVLDADDACPDQKGTVSTRGCPDRDVDGVADRDDACPDKKGPASSKGCPDTDGDGVTDDVDRCVDKAGTVANKGCPEIKAEDKAKLERAIKLVQFESGKDVLLKKSYAVLDEVVSVMAAYPDYSLNINGHTDSQGDDKMNQSLSERRAKACFDYLVSKGVAAARMAHAGFGETQPVADNGTAAGREQNRRVVFELFVK